MTIGMSADVDVTSFRLAAITGCAITGRRVISFRSIGIQRPTPEYRVRLRRVRAGGQQDEEERTRSKQSAAI